MSNPNFGSLEVYFTFTPVEDVPNMLSTTVELITNIQGTKMFSKDELAQAISLVVSTYANYPTGERYVRVETKLGTDIIDRADFSTGVIADVTDYLMGNYIFTPFAVRIFFFDGFVSVNVNDLWAYSYAFASIAYAATTTAVLKLHGASLTITNIRRVELADGREAVYVDYESSTDNAIQSVIQQRPVQIFPSVDRKLSFTYVAEKDTIDAVFVSQYRESTVRPGGLSSDGLVYADDVGVSIDTETARAVGLITKLYRLSELTTGAERAAGILQRQARQRREPVQVVQRFDPRIQATDVLNVDLVTTSTLRRIQRQVIVEDISFSLRDGEYSMSISGRKKA